MEFKDCQSGRKGLALVEKERDATQVAISNGLTDCEFYRARNVAKKLFQAEKPSLLLDGWQIFANSFQMKTAYLDSLLYKENWNKIRVITTYDVHKWEDIFSLGWWSSRSTSGQCLLFVLL